MTNSIRHHYPTLKEMMDSDDYKKATQYLEYTMPILQIAAEKEQISNMLKFLMLGELAKKHIGTHYYEPIAKQGQELLDKYELYV